MRLLRLCAVACALVTVLAACGGDDSGSQSTTTLTSPVTGPTSSSTPASTAPCVVRGAGTATQSQTSNGDVALLTGVRTGRQECADRVVFDFRGAAPPGYTVGYEPGPFTLGQSDMPVAVAGSAFLVVRMTPASGVDLSSPDATPTYGGPASITPGALASVDEIRRMEDFEANLVWVVGLDAQRPFTVGTLRDPSRIYIDVSDT